MAGRVAFSPGHGLREIGIRAGVVRILHVVGARPNFVKAAPVMRALRGRAQQMLVANWQTWATKSPQSDGPRIHLRNSTPI